ncbi:MAG: hypothetical protein JW827_08380 [Spirochaetes bacterium]|nr:hypothetical protein [Spirochaetota bacterium]
MPDIITHMGFNYLVYRAFKKRFNLFLFLLGSFLPDLAVGVKIIIIDIFHFSPVEFVIGYSVLFHTLIISLLFCLSLGILFEKPLFSTVSLYSGVLAHLLLDFLQDNWGKGLLLFFPFYNRPVKLGFFTYGIEFRYIYVLIPLAIFIYLWKKENLQIRPVVNYKRILLSLFFTFCIIFLALSQRQKIFESGVFCIDFRFNPEKYHGNPIVFNNVPIVSEKPLQIYARKMILNLKGVKTKFLKGTKVVLKGTYHHPEKSIYVAKIYLRDYSYKQMISFFGLILFAGFIIKSHYALKKDHKK